MAYLKSGALKVIPAVTGTILQVVQTFDDNSFSFANGSQWGWGTAGGIADDSYAGVACDLNVGLTTKGTNSKFFVSINLSQYSTNGSGYITGFRTYWSVDSYAAPLVKGSTSRGEYSLAQEVQAGVWTQHVGDQTPPNMNSNFLYAGSVAINSAITFKIVFSSYYTATGNTVTYNRQDATISQNHAVRINPTSTHTVFEVAA